jgi:branched-chain amino acid transport system ATP-binding protein
MSTPALETRHLVKRFGGLTVSDRVSLAIPAGARHALIGPNGAGKTTLVNLLTGRLAPTGGYIFLDGADITRERAHRRVARGLVRTFQVNELFPGMTPLEAVTLAILQRDGDGARWWRRLAAGTAAPTEALRLLDRLNLRDCAHHPTRTLPYGRQRLLEIALALAARPRVLLLDEPAAGVSEGERSGLIAAIAALPRTVTILLIEHDMDLVFRFAERITVLVGGAVLAEGPREEIAADRRVQEVYLGTARHG